MLAVFECVAEAVRNKGFKGLCELVPGAAYALDVAADAYRLLRERRRDAEVRAELAKVAAASAQEARKAAAEVARHVANEARPDEQVALQLYLTLVPGALRASLKRADDPSGRSVPAGFAVDSAHDLARVLPARVPLFRPGAAVPGRSEWRLDELLGAGGFGEVWLARHSLLPHPRAVKFCTDPHARTRLASHEGTLIARVMAAGDHPNVVPLLDAVLDGETPWLMYEFVGGGCLTDLILRWQALPGPVREAAAVAALRQLAAAVGTFHRLDPPVVHRDLKPANVLVSASGGLTEQLRITDFGIGGVVEPPRGAPAAGRLGTGLRGSYTPVYASPQQRDGGPPDPRDDVHALGVIAFHMMTGRLADAPGIDAADELKDRGASAGFVALVARCVATKSERRPRDGAELAELLARLTTPPATPARPIWSQGV